MNIEESFRQFFGRTPRWAARAPGRVNLIGEHTDYNDGYVLPMAIERDTTIVAAPNDSMVVNLRSSSMDDVVRIDLTLPSARPAPHWSNYVRGVVAGFIDAGYRIEGFDALVHTTVPIGGGVSSSAALEVATATLLEIMCERRLDPAQKALLCQRAEHEYAGMPCGIMDQFVSTFGRKDHLLLLDCQSEKMEQIELTDDSVSVLIINSNVKHNLASSQYAVRRAQCEQAASQLQVKSLRFATMVQLQRASDSLDAVVLRRARHVIGEIERTVKMAERVRSRDWLGSGQLMYLSHESLRSDYEVSCPELDVIVESAQNIGVKGGVYGCRMTGGGFGGCAVALVQRSAEDAIARTLATEYTAQTDIVPTIFSSRPAQGTTSILLDSGCSQLRTVA